VLTSKDLAELLAETPPCEACEVANEPVARGSQQVRDENHGANFAKWLPSDDLITSPSSQTPQDYEVVANPIPEPSLATSQNSLQGVRPPQLSGNAAEAARALINRAPLTMEQRESRLADLARAPELARFWLIVWAADGTDLPNDFGKI